MMKKQILIFLFTCLLSLHSLYAGAFLGADIRYEYLGNCTYRLFYTSYQDCSFTFFMSSCVPLTITNLCYSFPPTTFTAIGGTMPLITPTWITDSVKEVSHFCINTPTACNGGTIEGVAAYYAHADINLCAATGTSVKIEYNPGGLTYGIYNGQGGQGLHIENIIPLLIDNTAPEFVTPPILYVPAGQSSTFQQLAIDKDGDSLVYSFSPCLQSGGMMPTYNPGYSATNFLGASWNTSIDAITGEVSIVPIGGLITNSIIGIQVDEYRNGVLIGHISRNVVVKVLNSTYNTYPTSNLTNVTGVGVQNITAPITLRTEADSLLSFDLVVTDPDIGQLLAYTSNISSQFPNATLTANGNTNPMTLTFSWTPDSTDKGKSYPLIIDVFDDHCDLIGYQYILANIVIDSNYINAIIMPSDCTLPTGAIDITVGGGIPPYTYSWNNGATTEDLINIGDGAYILEVTDANGTVWTADTFFVSALGLSSVINKTSPDCFVATGAMGIDMFGGVSPYTYTWSNGMIGDTISNLPIGGYSVDVTDALGCFYHTATMLDFYPFDSCFSRIEGIVYNDNNGNCVQDFGENGVPYMMVGLYGNYAYFTDANGHYSYTVFDTGTYQLHINPSYLANAMSNCVLPNFMLNTYVSNLGKDTLHNDFPIQFIPDLRVFGSGTYYNPFMSQYVNLAFINSNYYLSNFDMYYQHDSLINVNGFSIPPTNYDTVTNIAHWNVTNFPANSYWNVTLSVTANVNAPIHLSLYSSAWIQPILGELDTINNHTEFVGIMLSSDDPNYKAVFPAGEGIYGLIPANTEELSYTIHFQNTGNWQAYYVVIRDTIDINALDINTTEIQGLSHACNITIEQDSILVFTFNNINLPDSTTNEPASHGFVQYGIKIKPNLPLYTTIQNSASIYFDFNQPVKTNTTLNTLYNPMNLSVTANTNICPEDSILAVVIEGRLPYQFDWSNGVQDNNNTSGQSQILANFTTGTHNVSITDYYGLTTTQSFMLNVLPLANAAFTYNPAGSNYFFTANSFNNASYLWDFGNGQTSTTPAATATYTQNGSYTVMLIVTDLCGGADTSTQTINLSVGLSPSLFQQQVSIFPNPTADIVLLSFQNEAREPYTLTISDINGKVIKSMLNISEEKITIHTNDMASGTYFWELKGKEVARGVLLVE